MKQPFLIQRLLKPTGHAIQPFGSFGCTYNGAFKDEAIKLLSPIMTFDYMGSAEYEFGAVPTAFSNMLLLYASDRCRCVSFKIKNKNKDFIEINALCHDSISSSVIEYLQLLYTGDIDYKLKESTNFKHAIDGADFCNRCAGWIELDNPFMFFIDNEMYENVMKLFDKIKMILNMMCPKCNKQGESKDFPFESREERLERVYQSLKVLSPKDTEQKLRDNARSYCQGSVNTRKCICGHIFQNLKAPNRYWK